MSRKASRRNAKTTASELRAQARKSGGKHDSFLGSLEKQRGRLQIQRNSKEAQNWFLNRVRDLDSDSAFTRLERDARKRNQILERDPGIGFMYMFKYFAKHDKTLPYWDRNPLIFMIAPAKGGWYGLNLHYLPPRRRAVFLDKLMSIASDTRYSPRTKLKITYGLLKSTERFPEYKACIKRYLKSQLRSNIIKIPSNEWSSVIMLPLQSFKGASNQNVWSESAKKARSK